MAKKKDVVDAVENEEDNSELQQDNTEVETVKVKLKGQKSKENIRALGHKFESDDNGCLTCKMPKSEAEEWAKAGKVLILENDNG